MGGGGIGLGISQDDAVRRASEREVARMRASYGPPEQPANSTDEAAFNEIVSSRTFVERQADIDQITTTSPYAAQAMQDELHADVADAEARAVELRVNIDALGTSGGFATSAMVNELGIIETELEEYWQAEADKTVDATGETNATPIEEDDAPVTELPPTPSIAEIERSEDALLRSSPEGRGEMTNPVTGDTYSDAEIEQAVDNAIDRRIELTDYYFPVLDNPKGGTDGSILIDEDVAELARGDYDTDLVRDRLLEMGVPESELDQAIADVEQLAVDIRDIPELRDLLDSANTLSGDTNGKIRRGDVDNLMLGVLQASPAPEAEGAPVLNASQQQEAQELAVRWSVPANLARDLNNTNLEDMSDVERLVLAEIAQTDDSVFDATLRNFVADSVQRADSLDGISSDIGTQVLVGRYVASPAIDPPVTDNQAAANEHLVALVDQDINAIVDDRLQNRRGDSEADLTLERLDYDVAAVIAEQPASAGLITNSINTTFEDRGGDVTDVRRADDNFIQDTNHLVTGVGGSVLGFTGDAIRFSGDVAGTVLMTPIRVSGEVADFGLDVSGNVLGAGLDVVGADGAADAVREQYDDFGNVINSTTDVVGEFGEGLVTLATEAPAATVDWDWDSDRVNEAIGTVEIEAGQLSVDVEDAVGLAPTVVEVNDLLSLEQKTRVEAIFGSGISYDDVEVVVDGANIIMKISGDRPLVGGNQIVFSREGVDPNNPSLSDDQFGEFVHELGHVWQAQNVGNQYAFEGQLAQEFGEGYNVGNAVDRSLSESDRLPLFEELNREQQAEIFLVAHESGYLDDPDQLIMIRTKNANSTGGLHGGSFEVTVVDRNDAAEVQQLDGDGWTDMTPLMINALETVQG